MRCNKYFLIGGIDPEKNGQWEWVTGEPMEFTWWRESQPDPDKLDEPYIGLYRWPAQAGSWDDIADASSHVMFIAGFIAEWEGQPLPDSTDELKLSAQP